MHFFLHPTISSPLLTNILLSTLFSDTLSLCYFFNPWHEVSHLYKAKGNVILLYIFIFTFLNSWREGRMAEWQHALHKFNLIVISSWIGYWFVVNVLKYFKVAAFWNRL
jgi:glucose uptake protein GlcU